MCYSARLSLARPCCNNIQASALVRIVSVACPSVKIGVELLGRALQLAERDKMADHLEQVRPWFSQPPRDPNAPLFMKKRQHHRRNTP